MRSRKRNRSILSTRQLLGMDRIADYGLCTPMGDLVFFTVQPTNLSVLPASGIEARIAALLGLLKTQEGLELLALNSRETFENNKNFYRSRMETEPLPAVRRLLEQDRAHLDEIQTKMTLAREFYFVLRIKGQKESVLSPYLSRVEKSIRDLGFTVRRAGTQELRQMLAVYFAQDVTTEQFRAYDGEVIP